VIEFAGWLEHGNLLKSHILGNINPLVEMRD